MSGYALRANPTYEYGQTLKYVVQPCSQGGGWLRNLASSVSS